ncbi:hypothetical protein B0O80DRAFT_440315 [Mortierella sp. GBAus27b]|nr:hypothetical protein B0O80DRAFT_440315 [Mortierella sp. GBAus27b]
MELQQRGQELLQECIETVASLEEWRTANPTLEVDGLQKMTSALHAEQKFLEKLASTPADEIQPAQISSTNVPHLKSLVWALVNSKNPVAIRKTFTYTLDPYTIIEPSEKFKAIPDKPGKGKPKGGKGSKVMQLSTSEPLSTNLVNERTLQVKVDLVADHGASWLRINAGSSWSLIHEFAGMEDDSSDEEGDDDEDTSQGPNGCIRTKKPETVSKDTHPDMTLMTRSLVLAADQNRLHYEHRPKVTLRFAGILPEEHPELEAMIHRSVRVAQVAQSIADNSIMSFPIKVDFGPFEHTTAAVVSSTPLDPHFTPFSIPQSVDDMGYFTSTLHLDITTLMALSCYLCHAIRPDPNLFTSPPLVLQAQLEHDQPLLPVLAKIFQGRERLVMCRTAATRFKAILNVIGGPEEKWRGSVMIHDPLDETGTDQSSKEDKDRIRDRWIQGSDWAQQYGVFADGPPRIEVIEDMVDPDDSGEDKVETEQAGKVDPTIDLSLPPEALLTSSTDSTSEELDPSSSPASLSTSSSSSPAPAARAGPTRRELNMTELHTRIFATGHNARLTTLTANLVGYRTLTRIGRLPSEISMWNHGPRSLAEAKLPPGTL